MQQSSQKADKMLHCGAQTIGGTHTCKSSFDDPDVPVAAPAADAAADEVAKTAAPAERNLRRRRNLMQSPDPLPSATGIRSRGCVGVRVRVGAPCGPPQPATNADAPDLEPKTEAIRLVLELAA